MSELTVIIPVYNEENAIVDFYRDLKEQLDKSQIDSEILFVNDGSTDESKTILDSLGTNVIHLQRNHGYGGAIKIGMRSAKSDILAIIDCDGTYNPSDLVNLYRNMPDSDMVVGQRSPEKGLRRVSKGILKAIASYAVNYPIPDLNSGLRVFRKDLAMHLMSILPNGFSLTSTITMGTLYIPYRIKYIPIAYNHRVGSSKIQPVRAFSQFTILIIRTMILFNPLKFFLPASIFMASIGVLFMLRDIMAGNIAQGSLLFLVNAFILFAIGLLAESNRSKI